MVQKGAFMAGAYQSTQLHAGHKQQVGGGVLHNTRCRPRGWETKHEISGIKDCKQLQTGGLEVGFDSYSDQRQLELWNATALRPETLC